MNLTAVEIGNDVNIGEVWRTSAKTLGRLAFKLFFGLAARLHWYWPFVKLLTYVIEERRVGGVTAGPGAMTLIALSPEEFRGDLDVLAAIGRFRILQVPSPWQTRLIYLFYEPLLQADIDMNPVPGTGAADCKQRLQRFYAKVLPKVYARLGVDSVISSHMRWLADVDWGIVSRDLGFPYVVLYREGLFAASEYMQQSMLEKFRVWGWFQATHLVVHTEIGRRYCLDIGYGEPNQVSSLGCLRMDGYIEKIRNYRPSEMAEPKKVVLFPPQFNENFLVGRPLFPVFKEIHVALAELAIRRPDLEIIIKLKAKDYKVWAKLINHSFRGETFSIDDITNLSISTKLDAHDLILNAAVVCGFNSTTVLEAAVAGKSVVVPYFKEMRQQLFKKYTLFPDALQNLDTADDPENFLQLIEQRIENPPRVTAEQMAEREKMFANYVSDPRGGAVQRYSDLFERLIIESREARLGTQNPPA